MAEDELFERYLTAQSACQKLAHVLYTDPQVQAKYPNGVDSMFTLDAKIHAAPISVRARAMEAKLEILRTVPLQHISNTELISYPEHTARRTEGPAAAAAPASPPAAILAAARGAARGGYRPAHAPPRGEPIPPLPPCDRTTTKKSVVDVQSLWESAVRVCREAERPLRPCEIIEVWKALFPALSPGTLHKYDGLHRIKFRPLPVSDTQHFL